MKAIVKKIIICVSIFIGGGLIGFLIAAAMLSDTLVKTNRMFVNRCFGDWYGTAWHAYYDEDPQIALWSLKTVLKYYEEKYPLRDLPDGEGAYDLDIARMYTKVAILLKAKGDIENYKKYIGKALAFAGNSENSKLKEFKAEEDLVAYQKEWEEAYAKVKREKHNKKLHGTDKPPASQTDAGL